MWEQYVEKAREESAALGERALEVRFEDLLNAAGAASCRPIAKFCGCRRRRGTESRSAASKRIGLSHFAAIPTSLRSAESDARLSRATVTRRELPRTLSA